jgi:hypothetical protein
MLGGLEALDVSNGVVQDVVKSAAIEPERARACAVP